MSSVVILDAAVFEIMCGKTDRQKDKRCQKPYLQPSQVHLETAH